MRRVSEVRARLTGAVALLLTLSGAVAMMPTAASATASFTLQRIAGSDRYATAGAVDQAAFPSGEPTALLADGVPGHQSDALSAAGVEGSYGLGVLLTDNTNTVPSSTTAALQANKVSKIVVLGGTGAVSQAQISALQSAGYQVSTPYQGTTRYQTMKMVDESMGGAGTDGSGNPTAILASGENKHLVDALAAGGLAYSRKFPIILTNSSGPGLQPEAQQVISDMGIKHLIVVGGTASIPASEYTPPPSGVTTVDVEAGGDRSATSKVLADYGIQKGWLANTNLTVARGDDGADALAGAALAGVKGWPTVVTNSPTDAGSTTAFATEHQSTLAGTSYVFGGTSAVPDSQMSAIQAAGQGPGSKPASAGTFGTAAGTTPVVDSESSSTFTEGGLAYTYGPSDTYQIVQQSSSPGGSASCVSDTFSDFQARLSNGDSVSGNYQPGKTSTFCLNDVAPHPPSSVTTTSNSTTGGVTVTWSAPSTAGTDNVTGYTVWRAPATPSSIPGGSDTCPAAYSTAPGSSPQNTPPSPYKAVASDVGGSGSGGSTSYNDTATVTGSDYCYAVSSESPNAAGGTQVGTAQPAGANQLQPSQPAPVAAGAPSTSSAPRSISTSYVPASASSTTVSQGDQLIVNFDQAVSVGSNYTVILADQCTNGGTPDTCKDNQSQLNPLDSSAALSNGNKTVTFTLNTPLPSQTPLTAKDLEVLSASGITNGAGQSWNLPGSGVTTGPLAPGNAGTPATLSRVFDSPTPANANNDLPAAPGVFSLIASGTGPTANMVTYKCSDPSSSWLNIYNTSGTLLASAPCGSGPNHPYQSAVPTAASSPVTFTSGTAYLFTESNGSSPGTAANSLGQDNSIGQESQTASLVASAPGQPRMTRLTISTSSTNQQAVVDYDEPIACATVDPASATATDYTVTVTPASGPSTTPTITSITCSGSGGYSPTVTLTLPSGSFAAGDTVTVTSRVGTDNDTVCTQAAPNNNTCESSGDHLTVTAS